VPASVRGGFDSVGALESGGFSSVGGRESDGFTAVGALVSDGASVSILPLARPKSRSLAPDRVSITLPGLRSR
jgi:hypothetical protein